MKPCLIYHSDRGVQYPCQGFRALLKVHGIECSISSKGDCWGNAAVESFFHTLRATHNENYKARQQAQADNMEYTEEFYNRQHRHSFLDYLSPVEFEKMVKAS